MEAARPRRNRHRKKQQQQQATEHVATTTSSSSSVVVDNAQVQTQAPDTAQRRSTRESSSGSASSDNADEAFDETEHDDDADRMMQDMLAVMEADMAESSSRTSDTHSAIHVSDEAPDDADETKATVPLPVADTEIAQNEDDLLSILGAAPMTTDAPYALTERSNTPQLTIEIPAPDVTQEDVADHSGSEASRSRDSAAGAQTPSAPAFDDDDDEAHGDLTASFRTLARASESAMQRPVAPSAPHFPDSDDESAIVEHKGSAPTNVSVQRVAALKSDGLMATGAPESSPFGPRGTATPSAPPAIDLDEKQKSDIPGSTAPMDAGSAPGTASLATAESVDTGVNRVDVANVAPSAPPAIDTTPLTPTELPVASSTAPSAPLMPSLSPTATKTISRTASRTSDSDSLATQTAAAAMPAPTESVGRAVRNSFAKARMLDASRNLYPSVLQRAMSRDSSASSSFASVAADGQVFAAHARTAAAAATRIQIKLEPFVNFEMNLMRAEASQKRQELKMQRIESNKGELFSRLERYLFSEYLLHTAASSLEASKTEVENLMKKVWTLETKRLSSSQRCGDHVEISQQLEFQTAKLEPLQLAKLKAHLDKLRQLRTVESSLHTFDRALAYFHVEQYLNGLLHEPNLVAFLNKMSVTCASPHVSRTSASGAASDLDVVPERISFFDTLPAGSTLASTVDHLKYCVDVLVYFEKKVTMVDEKGSFGRVPHAFYRGELVWHSPSAASSHSSSSTSHHGMVRKIKCYACGCLNAPMETAQCCTLCDSCNVVLYLPPSSVATNSTEWYSSVVRFRESLQKWIASCLHTLLRTKLLSNMPYVLMHVMYLPRIATEERSWMLRFLQFPRALVATTGAVREAWTEDLVDHYLAMLHLVFHPEKLRRMSVLVSSGPPPPSASSAPSAMNGATETTVAVSPEWVLLENPEVLDRCFLSDDDFVAVLNQFPNTFAFEQLFQCTLETKKSFSRALTLVLELTQSLRAFQEFEKFPVRIAQLLGELLVSASQISASTASTSVTTNAVVYYPTLFDQLFLTALHGLLLSDCNRVAWKSLRCFPFASLSELAKWDVLALLLFNVHSVPPEAKSVSGWMQFVQRAVSDSSSSSNSGTNDSGESAKAARETLYDLIATDTENAVYLLHAVAHLAASCTSTSTSDDRSALVSVAVHELFLAGYTVPACQRALGENGERAAVPISTICLAHPWIISSLISLLFKYHECAATWIHVFETFPVNRWTPTPSDLVHIQEWLLLENTSAPRCALARFLLDHINWEYDVHTRALFTSPWLHRRVALIVAEAFVLYKTRRERASDAASAIVLSGGGAPQKLEVAAITKSIRRALWLDDTFDFPQWCWKLVLKLKFYSPATHEPFIELIDLSRDRSREALTLRRWFANASKPLSAMIKCVPFYASRETELAQLRTVQSGAEQLAQDIATTHAVIGGSTGAPIHEDASEQASSESERTSGLAATTVAATAAQTTEPIVAYLIGQITTFVLSDRIDRWEPLLILLKHDLFHATIRVLENVFPVLASFDRMKRSCATPSAPADNTVERSSETELSDGDAEPVSQTSDDLAATTTAPPAPALDLEVEMCMAGIQTLSTSELLQFVGVLFDNAYINSDERSRIEDVLQQGYIGGWESTAKAKVLSKLRFVRECSRYLHPALLPALINESFPRSSTAARTTSALFHGAMSWLSSTLRGGKSDALSPSSATTATAALTMRRSSIAGSASSAAAPASLGMLTASTEYTASTKALCSLIEREFEYSAGTDAFAHAMTFWMQVLLHVPFWFEHHAFRHVLDVLMRCSMARHYATPAPSQLVQPPRSTTNVLLLDLVAMLETAFETLCYQLKASQDDPSLRDEPGAPLVVSFLPPTDATALSSIFGAAFDAAQHVGGCSFLAFWALLIETRQELPLFRAMGTLMLKYEPKTMAKVEKWKKTKGKLASELALVGLNTSPTGSPAAPVYSKSYLYGHTTFDSLSQYKLYRWCAYCLEMPEDDAAQVLYWQVFFALYFACAGGTRIFGHYFLERDASHRAKRVHMRKHLQRKLRTMINYCSTQAQVVLTTTSGVGTTVSATASSTVSEMKERKYAHFVTLSQLYTAMDAWLEEPDPNVWIKDDELVTLPRHYEVRRLQDVLRLSDALLTPTATRDAFDWSELPLWTTLCGFEFSFRQQQHTADSDAASGDASDRASSRGMSSLLLERRPSDLLDEEEFAFVEDASDLRRHHSSFGSTFGDASRSIRPLPLLAEHCGPATLTMLPLVSLAVSEESCVVTPSIQLNKQGLKSIAVKFSENLSVLVALDAELMDHVSQLYASKTRTVTQSIPCLEGSSCRQPASFRFEFLEWSVDKALLDAAQTIVAQSERCDMKAMLTNMTTWTVMDRHDASANTSMTRASGGAEHFLKLDGDGAMLVMQILLIDEIVRTLDAELQSVRREEQAARDRSEQRTNSADAPEASESSSATTEVAVAAPPPVKQWDKVLDRLHEKGLEWFRLLTDLDTKLSRMVPPLREVLWRAIKQLGASFVCVDERETYTLLELMLDDPSRINLLSDCFYPAGAPTRFVEMFSKLLSASGSAKLSTEEKLVLLQRFDFRKWLAPPKSSSKATAPSKFDRETVLCIVLADVSAQFPADRSLSSSKANSSGSGATDRALASGDKHFADAVLRFYAEVIHLICASHLEDHAEKVLHALVGVHDDYRFHNSTSHHASAASDESSESTSLSALPRPVDAKVWEAIVTIPLDAWQRLPFAQLETCVAFFSHHMTTLRWQTALSSTTASSSSSAKTAAQYPIVYWQQLGVLKYFLDLFTIVCRVAPPAQQWSLITTFFEPLLSTLYQPANTTESSSISSPWSDQDSFSTGTAVCSCFVAACTELLRKKKTKPSPVSPRSPPTVLSPTARDASLVDAVESDNAKLTQIWTFYLNVLIPHAPVHICKHLHQFLTRIAWEHWCLTLEIVQQMRELVQRETQQLATSSSASDTVSSYPFVSWMVRDILCRMTWKSTDAWLAQQGETIASLFLLEFAKLCVELVLDLPHFSPQRASGPRSRLLPSSTNVLPPYFVNFVKQQSAFWAKWTMAASDLDALLQFTLDAVKAPLLAASESVGYRESSAAQSSATAIFPANATPAVMQDGFTRLQLVLRLLAQVTTIHHTGMPRTEAFSRVDRYLRMLYSVFEIDAVGNDFAFVPSRTSDPSAWLVVLHSASCTVLYEKLDEIVQLYRSDASDSDNDAVVAQDALTTTLVGVLRFCNLPLVERFFKDEQSRRFGATKGSPTSSVSLSWAKCGNVIFVEIDSLVRDFAASHKAMFESKSAASAASRSSGSDKSDDDDSSGNGASRTSGGFTSSDASGKLVASEAVGNRLGRLLWSFLAFRGGELCCLSGCGRAIASVHVMSQVAEKSIEKWIIEDRRGAWSDLVMRLKVPELSEEEFESACLEQGNLMTLQVLFMQQLRKAPVLTEAFAMGMLSKLLSWMSKMQIASKSSLIEMKVLFFAAEVTHFVCHALAETLPSHLKKQMLRQVCSILLAFGNARKQHGIMKAIGMGGSLKHNAEFHVASLTIGVFLRLQTRTSVPLRTDDRIPLKVTRTSEKHLRSLEDLLKTKDCFQIGKRMDWMLEFLKNPKRSLADQDEFFVSLFSRLYPSHPWLLAKCTYE